MLVLNTSNIRLQKGTNLRSLADLQGLPHAKTAFSPRFQVLQWWTSYLLAKVRKKSDFLKILRRKRNSWVPPIFRPSSPQTRLTFPVPKRCSCSNTFGTWPSMWNKTCQACQISLSTLWTTSRMEIRRRLTSNLSTKPQNTWKVWCPLLESSKNSVQILSSSQECFPSSPLKTTTFSLRSRTNMRRIWLWSRELTSRTSRQQSRHMNNNF